MCGRLSLLRFLFSRIIYAKSVNGGSSSGTDEGADKSKPSTEEANQKLKLSNKVITFYRII